MYLYNCVSLRVCICTFIHLMRDKIPRRVDPLNITPRWAGRLLTAGQQSHRQGKAMFMFNPETRHHLVPRAGRPIAILVQILCHLCSHRHHSSDPMSGQMRRLRIKFAIKPAQCKVIPISYISKLGRHMKDGSRSELKMSD